MADESTIRLRRAPATGCARVMADATAALVGKKTFFMESDQETGDEPLALLSKASLSGLKSWAAEGRKVSKNSPSPGMQAAA